MTHGGNVYGNFTPLYKYKSGLFCFRNNTHQTQVHPRIEDGKPDFVLCHITTAKCQINTQLIPYGLLNWVNEKYLIMLFDTSKLTSRDKETDY